MSIYKITFSPTGGTQNVADFFANSYCKEPITLDLSDKTIKLEEICLTPNDVCIVAVPSFGGRVPEVAVSRLKQLRGENAIAIMIVVYGNRAYDDTLLELHDTLYEAGFRCVAAVAAIAEHSIVRQFATGRPDKNDREELIAFAEKIKNKIEINRLFTDPKIPGNKPYREFGGSPMKPSAGKACTKCGICAVKCPVDAISTDDPSKTDNAKCITCMRCISVCPCNARSISKILVTVLSQKLNRACKEPKKNELFL